jgi:acyl-coenzyme A thioesterase 13
MFNPAAHLVATSVSTSQKAPFSEVTYTFTVYPGLCNALGIIHGAAVAMMFDDLTSFTVQTLIGTKEAAGWTNPGVSRTLNCTYLKGAQVGDEVEVHTEVTGMSRKMGESINISYLGTGS